MLLSGIQQIQTLAPQGADEDSAMVDQQNRVRDIQKGKKTAAEKQSSESPKAKKHKSMDSSEDHEEPQSESGTSSNSQHLHQYFLFIKDQQQVLKDQLRQTNLVNEDNEYSDEKSAQSQDSEKALSTQISTF